MKLIISVVTWNNENQIDALLTSLKAQKLNCESKIVICDNASTDRTREKVKEHENVTLITNRENLGFGKAHNKVMKLYDADYYFVLIDKSLFVQLLNEIDIERRRCFEVDIILQCLFQHE